MWHRISSLADADGIAEQSGGLRMVNVRGVIKGDRADMDNMNA